MKCERRLFSKFPVPETSTRLDNHLYSPSQPHTSLPIRRLHSLTARRALSYGQCRDSQTITAPSVPPTHSFPLTLQQIVIDLFPCYISSVLPLVAAQDPLSTYWSAVASLNLTAGLPDPLGDFYSRDNPVFVYAIQGSDRLKTLEAYQKQERRRRSGLEYTGRECTAGKLDGMVISLRLT